MTVGSSMRLPAGTTASLALFFLAVVFAVLSYLRTGSFRQRSGQNPWGIHPIVWGVAGFIFGIIGLLIALLACLTTKPRPATGGSGPHDRFATPHVAPQPTVSEHYGTPAGPAALAALPTPGPTSSAGPPPGWHPDPADPGRLRLWTGDDWSDEVLEAGVVNRSPLPPFPG